jgi:hypothetical protein
MANRSADMAVRRAIGWDVRGRASVRDRPSPSTDPIAIEGISALSFSLSLSLVSLPSPLLPPSSTLLPQLFLSPVLGIHVPVPVALALSAPLAVLALELSKNPLAPLLPASSPSSSSAAFSSLSLSFSRPPCLVPLSAPVAALEGRRCSR